MTKLPRRKISASEAPAKSASADSLESSLLGSTGYLLARIGMESRRRWTRMLTRHAITPHQFGVLAALGSVDTASQRHLSQSLGVDPRNAMAIFDALEERRLIERAVDPKDRRRHAVRLTALGHKKLRELRRTGDELEAQMLEGFSKPERQDLHKLLFKLFAAMAD